ncbi:HD domain-containing protein [Candidatus Gottesmanbacteria bacterium]|nr:HD domain-containing protein [Candidatus Gottesmanbacteria bacterium]
MPEESRDKNLSPKKLQIISSKVLDALGGTRRVKKVGDQEVTLIEGAYLWGVDDPEKGKGILRHSGLVSRIAYYLAEDLKKRGVEGFENINSGYAALGGLFHDTRKLWAESREFLTLEQKVALGILADFKESSSGSDEVAADQLKELGFPPEVYEAIRGHDFPEEIINNPYWKVVSLADHMAGQTIMTVDKRLRDIRTRWIDERRTEGQPPRIEPERSELAAKNIETVAREIFGGLGTTDKEFIEKHKLNSKESQTRWERFLLLTAKKGRETRAKQLVKLFIG